MKKLLLFLFFLLYFSFNVDIIHAQTPLIIYDELETNNDLKLEFTFLDDLLGTAVIDDKETLLYSYKTLLIIPKEFEIYDLRTPYSQTFNNLDNSKRLEIISGAPQYYQDEYNNWYQADYATTTLSSFELQMPDITKEITYWDEFVNFFKVAPAYTASSTFYPDGGVNSVDGRTYRSNLTTWTLTREATTAQGAQDTNTSDVINNTEYNPNLYGIARYFTSFDTSDLPDDCTIDSATISVTQVTTAMPTDDDSFEVGLLESSQASDNALVIGDYEDCGDLDTPTEGATRKNVSDFSLGSTETFTLNSSGLSWIDKTGVSNFCFRLSGDIDDTEPTGVNQLQWYNSEQAGTDDDPVLVVNYTEATSTPGATTTVTSGALPIFNDITIISGYIEHYTDSTSTPSETEYIVYHIPALLMYFLLAIILPILLRIILEIIIRLRQ